MNNNLIITRFTQGSAGKFLSTVLQTNKYVDHWSSVVQHQFDKTLELNNMFVDLENFFNVDRFVNSIIELFSHFDLGTVNIDLIKSMHKIWLSRQHAY
jgi:hypothetical protein